jgi:hypothetical protein
MSTPVDADDFASRLTADAGSGEVPIDLRVGIVGHRWIPDNPAARSAVEAALRDIGSRSTTGVGATPVGLTIVSALAEGADRITAAVGRSMGGRLEVVLPLLASDYERDFANPRSRGDFRELLASAASVTTAPPAESRDDAYFGAGKLLVDRVDVVLALWDGEQAGGTGGTAHIIDYADQQSVPVYWLEPDASRQTLTTRARANHPFPVDLGPLSASELAQLDQFNAPTVELPHDAAIAPTMAGIAFVPYFERADALALRYQRTLRRYSQAIYLLAVIAVAAAASQLVFFSSRPALVWIEVAALAIIVAVLAQSRRTRVVQRWLAARQFAESMRMAMVFRSVGLEISASSPVGSVGDPWVARGVREIWLRAQNITGETDELETIRQGLLRAWLDPQIEYQIVSESRAAGRHRLTSLLAAFLFAVSLMSAILHSLSVLTPKDAPEYWAYISIVVPAAAAAVSGYAAQREFLRQAIRSRRITQRLQQVRNDVVHAASVTDLQRAVSSVGGAIDIESLDWSTSVMIHEVELP